MSFHPEINQTYTTRQLTFQFPKGLNDLFSLARFYLKSKVIKVVTRGKI